jgi:hypothetical protein
MTLASPACRSGRRRSLRDGDVHRDHRQRVLFGEPRLPRRSVLAPFTVMACAATGTRHAMRAEIAKVFFMVPLSATSGLSPPPVSPHRFAPPCARRRSERRGCGWASPRRPGR